MDRLHRCPAHVLRPRNLANGFAHSQTLNDLPYFEHIEPPESHRVPLGKFSTVTQSRSPRPLKHHNTGPIWPQTGWLYLAANRVALSGRKSGGSIWPQLKWLYVPANSQLRQNEAIAASWPGDVLYARVRDILADGVVTPEERTYLTEMLQQLIGGTKEDLAESTHVTELALDRTASVTIPNSTFCLTGDFVFATRSYCESVTLKRGGFVSKSVTKKVTYVVVGGLGSAEWKHGSFGLKIEKAIEYKREGVPLLIVHEDQWAAAL